MDIKFKSEDGCKIVRIGKYEFFAYQQGKEGYTLEIDEWFHVPHEYIANKYCSRKVQEGIPYESPCNIARIRERITNFLTTI